MPSKHQNSGKNTTKRGRIRNPDEASGEPPASVDDDTVPEWGNLPVSNISAVTDPLNRAIVQLLQEDGRTSYSAIGRRLNISEGAVRNRVNRMMEEKVFKIMAVADPVKLGYSAYAMIGLQLSPGTNPEEIANQFRRSSEVLFVMFTAGRYDLLVEVMFETQDELRAFLVEDCYARPEIKTVEPMLPLAMYKYQLKWGTD